MYSHVKPLEHFMVMLGAVSQYSSKNLLHSILALCPNKSVLLCPQPVPHVSHSIMWGTFIEKLCLLNVVILL